MYRVQANLETYFSTLKKLIVISDAVGSTSIDNEMSHKTDRPLIGILSQEVSDSIDNEFPGYHSYISAAYVKAIESSGGRAIPIFISKDRDYYRSILKSINGLLLPGGNTWFFQREGYADAGSFLYQEVRKLNDEGIHFPILAICLGFELLLFLDVGKQEYRSKCWAKNVALNLQFVADFRTSELFANASFEIIEILTNDAVTLNQHQFCVTEEDMTKFNLTEKWKILSYSFDNNTKVTFVSSVQSHLYPFVGLQFHPEKIFEWRNDLKNPHSYHSVLASRFFFDWFVNHSRLNDNHFETVTTENDHLIFNFHSTFTRGLLIYDELYLFKKNEDKDDQILFFSKQSIIKNSFILGFLLPVILCWRLSFHF